MLFVIDSKDLALALSVEFRLLLGEQLMTLFEDELQRELESEKVWEVMARRPDMCEDAMQKIFGSVGAKILRVAYNGAMTQMGIDYELNPNKEVSESA